MKYFLVFFLLAGSLILIGSCIKTDEKSGEGKAPGSSRGSSKISFKYDPRAKKEWLTVKKGQMEGSPVDVYVGDIKTGTLYYGATVQKIGEEKGWYKIRYSNKDGEFFGFIKYADAATAEKPKEEKMIIVEEDAEPKMYKMAQVEEKLDGILRVPYKLKVVQEQPEVKTEKVFASAGTPDGYDDLRLLKRFQNEPQAYVYANKIYGELENLYNRSPLEYQQVLDSYGKALKSFKDKNMRFFESYLEEAEQKRNYYRKSF